MNQQNFTNYFDLPRVDLAAGENSASSIMEGYSTINEILDLLNANLRRANKLQTSFLRHQALVLDMLSHFSKPSLLEVNQPIVDSPAALEKTVVNKSSPTQQFLFDKYQLDEFAQGSIAKCFGPDYAALDQRQAPRIPNGDLLMIERVLDISGTRYQLNAPAAITSEFDVPVNAWFINENIYPGIPLFILLEMALQPCGFLSAYLGTPLLLSGENSLFRNLDGCGNFLAMPDLAGQTITNQSRLLSSVNAGGTVIQKFAFELSCTGAVFFTGESSFGYFSPTSMEKQRGLDGGQSSSPWHANTTTLSDTLQHADLDHVLVDDGHKHSRLNLLDEIGFQENGGENHLGFIYAEKAMRTDEWFYKNHFYRDPVMPGSLGMEAILQAMWTYLRFYHLDEHLQHPKVNFLCDETLTWKYRGQATPINHKFTLEIHITHKVKSAGGIQLRGNANFWVDGTRIYAINNISITLSEGS